MKNYKQFFNHSESSCLSCWASVTLYMVGGGGGWTKNTLWPYEKIVYYTIATDPSSLPLLVQENIPVETQH